MISPDDGYALVRRFEVSERGGDLEITAHVVELGADCLVVLWGGRAHIGAVGIAQYRPSLSDPHKPAATSSVVALLGHKEDELAKSMSGELTRRLRRNTVVVAGIHWDDITEQAIGTVLDLSRRITERIIQSIEAGPEQA
jgi:gallate decarboxylase subunit D